MKQGKFVVDLQGVELPDELYLEIEAKIGEVVMAGLAKFPSPAKDRNTISVWARSPEWYGIWLRKFKSFEDISKNFAKFKDIAVSGTLKG
jgi:hypothetical protein